jgi:hypothetical protein
MSLRSFSVSYRFDGEVKPAALPEWLADSLDEGVVRANCLEPGRDGP